MPAAEAINSSCDKEKTSDMSVGGSSFAVCLMISVATATIVSIAITGIARLTPVSKACQAPRCSASRRSSASIRTRMRRYRKGEVAAVLISASPASNARRSSSLKRFSFSSSSSSLWRLGFIHIVHTSQKFPQHPPKPMLGAMRTHLYFGGRPSGQIRDLRDGKFFQLEQSQYQTVVG